MSSIIRKVYDEPEICQKFHYRAWVKLMHPFHPNMFIQNLLAQFHANSPEIQKQGTEVRGIEVLKRIKATAASVEDQLKELVELVNMQQYLIVLEDMSAMVEWDLIRTYIPEGNGSRIIVSIQHLDIARFCTGRPYFQDFSGGHSPDVIFKTVSVAP